MASYQGYVPRIRWGTSFAQELVFGLPLENALAFPRPAEGSAWAISDAGVEDAWITGTDYFLRGVIRRIPRDRQLNPAPATGWNESNGVEAWLTWMRGKNIGRYYPDGRNLIDSPKMDTDVDSNGVVNDFTHVTSGSITATPSLDGAQAAQKVICSAAAAAAYSQVAAGAVYGVRSGDAIAASVEYKTSGLANMEAQLHLAFYDASSVFISAVAATGLVSGTFVRASIAGTAPANTASATIALRALALAGAGAGSFWYRNLMVERKAAASATFIDNPGYQPFYLTEPMTEDPGQESNLVRNLPVLFRNANRVPFDGY